MNILSSILTSVQADMMVVGYIAAAFVATIAIVLIEQALRAGKPQQQENPFDAVARLERERRQREEEA